MNKIPLIVSGIVISCTTFSQKNPNIIYILADDLGYGDIRYLNKNSQIPTPNIDKMCMEGMYFTDAHSGSSVSTPTRYGIITGRYGFRSSLKKGVLGGYSKPLIEKDCITVGHVLQQSGYETAVIGKWHLGLGWGKRTDIEKQSTSPKKTLNITAANTNFQATLTDTPNNHGFDFSYILPASLDMEPYVYIENHNVVNPDMVSIDGSETERGYFWRKGMASRDFKIQQTLDHFSNKAIDFISNYKSDSPFFLYFPLTAPHTPWIPTDKFKEKSGAGLYGDFVCQVDDVVGRIIDVIDKKGIRENTLIIFASDNGADWKPEDLQTYPNHQANYLFKGQKSDIWEGGHHIPFIVRWPKVVKKNSVSNNLVCLTDLTATCADLTKQKIAKDVAIDSYSFLPILQGKASKRNTRSSLVHHSSLGMFSFRQGNWKYIDGNGSGGWSIANDTLSGQLYNLKKDPSETINLYNKYPVIVKKMKAKLKEIKAIN